MKTKVIVNPAARKGKSGKNWPLVEARLRQYIGDFDVTFTKAIGDATPIARAALAEGYDHFVVVGGDGTLSEAVNGLMEDGRLANPNAVVCPIPAGTANEVSRSLGLLDGADAPMKAAKDGRIAQIDVQRARCVDIDGKALERFALVGTNFGSAAEISRKTNESRFIKKLGGEACYYIVTAIVMLSYKPKLTRLSVDDGEEWSQPLHSAVINNIETTGGGMKIAPGARPDDGIFRGPLFGDFKATEFFTKPPSWLFEGRHVDHPKVTMQDGRKLKVECDIETMVDVDGEFVGYLPLELVVLPKAINIKVPS